MAQLAMNKGKAAMVRTETVKISGSLLSQRIQQFSLTLIGRLMNHSIQRMDSLVANMPKIWKMEDKVIGADLGKDIFQFNFQSEEDLQGLGALRAYYIKYLSLSYQFLGESLWSSYAFIGRSNINGCGEEGWSDSRNRRGLGKHADYCK
ncbi:hypothetical protein ISN45_Aa01g028290 [Arabidopsis thaliana x Arabidopsis arenosa]|uniref:DUF4283 domain-containing protein n=1 Tax=Arabidopsis thaliana x Arabidopsis arenosa TaxID=1240361 RepID=A0A8T2C6R8_9BRAS|nr:hypothetical protein ISN45_Aa01g028290 [Arabidopsis thaliana x Arabidopsis arenosa]